MLYLTFLLAFGLHQPHKFTSWLYMIVCFLTDFFLFYLFYYFSSSSKSCNSLEKIMLNIQYGNKELNLPYALTKTIGEVIWLNCCYSYCPDCWYFMYMLMVTIWYVVWGLLTIKAEKLQSRAMLVWKVYIHVLIKWKRRDHLRKDTGHFAELKTLFTGNLSFFLCQYIVKHTCELWNFGDI